VLQGREITDKGSQIDCLDGLRGVAVLIVFLSHTSNRGVFLLPFADFSGTGKSGVYLFFVLSSFLLTSPFLKKGAAARTKAFLLNYASRRILRIYPLYIVYLLLGLVTTLFLGRLIGSSTPVGIPFTLSIGELFNHLALRQAKGITWSIVVEFRYYFVLPFLALALAIPLRARVVPALMATAVLIAIDQFLFPQGATVDNDPRLGPYLPIFLMGSLLAVLHLGWKGAGLEANRKLRMALEILGIAALGATIGLAPSVASLVLGRELPSFYFHREILVFGLLWSVVVFACVNGTGFLRRIFELPVLRYFGFISFSVYLLHVIVVREFLEFGTGLPLLGWWMLAVTVAVSHASWTWIEKPSSKLRLFGARG
jgi:peptidoglycan/LPS O-acetylase OafA/YrhL